MEEGFVECTLFYCFYEKMAYVTETVKSHLADFTSVSQLVSQNEKVHTRWGWVMPTFETEQNRTENLLFI